ncbi:MAG TPA: PadR family transcriptional regulator [Candidatus Acetatifactor stercoripullorum]|uniref:PadR family transcriptional regulator n=1 Tax=Candidatus Acetatifactor stercoripullorum TaxID=2838414 RepID=A0A9D1R5D7_9FIRM|nr:PadR family transcriptional regulator [Candidatus Acetatifactor stercoripullorum]
MPDRNGKIFYTSITSLSHTSKRSENVFELKAGTLYPLLHAMESKGLVKSYEREAGGKTRKYYSITKEGKKLSLAKQKEWEEYSRGVRGVIGGGGYGFV